MTTKGWAVPAAGSSWADDEEEHVPPPSNPDFPSLGESVKQPAPKKKQKGQKVDLGKFLASGPGHHAPVSKVSDDDIRRLLPTAPRADRDEDGGDSRGGLGGGFSRDFGDRGFRGGFGGREEGRPGDRRGERSEFEPSRADTIDDWGKTKAFVPSDGARGGFGDRRTGGGFGGGGAGGDRFGDRPPMRPSSAADDVDDWGTSKKFEPSAPRPGGFRDGPPAPRRAGFENADASRADEEDQWSRGRSFQPSEAPAASRGGRGFGFSDRPATGDEDRWARKAPPAEASAAPASNGAPAERPRLQLQPRSVPLDSTASGSSAADTKSKSNPFGAARPREEVLKEKGVDPTKEELKLQLVDRETTPEEKTLMDQVEQLRKNLELLQASAPDPESIADEVASASDELNEKEKELLKLKTELDDKVRFAKAPAREKSDSGAAAPDTPGDKWRESRGDVRPARGTAPEPRGRSKENAPFAGAPGKERW